MIIYYHPRFQRSYRGLEQKTKMRAEARLEIFKKNPFDSRLGTHRLHGKLKKQLSYSVNSQYRILFEFLNKDKTEVIFLDIGTHDIYK
ncbi:MAG: hypothetical protein A3C06_03100 [Candidatus Taylorbacteria bacterium RIFCSPHIGHO2_02_FULL_46_13]|uniref:Plasmid stabilization protein n=1 Tax=Candidatus Taylorbacteria bacterium RIFCSPHIGHO2_02_FULL_46_13 TaxID=1802312 RepID=A0A1G2MRQ6_9BACT|nr:MAG: hypothetical protein A3C06_03100 [Candidatus Taylorbacteria bacterium RIFCSPHIGHO2_02_FULL_46_13]